MNRLRWIDALRGFAIFMVLAYHTHFNIEELPSILKFIANQGESGVQLFYIISAFTLFLSMRSRSSKKPAFQAGQEAPIERVMLKSFFYRRFFRIAPFFYFVILYYFFKNGLGPSYWIEDGKSITVPNLLAHLTFLNGWSPYWINTLVPGGWSVAIEMPFYLMVPLLYKKMTSLKQAVWLTGICFILSKFLSFFLKKYPLIDNNELWQAFLYYWLPNQLPMFFFGIILYFLYLETVVKSTHQGSPLLQKPALESSWGSKMVALLDTSTTVNLKNPIYLWLNTMKPLLIMGLSFLAFSFASKIDTSLELLFRGLVFVALAFFLQLKSFPLLVNRFSCYLGQISYSAYLVHFDVLNLTKNWLPNLFLTLKWTLFPTVNFLLSVLLNLSIVMVIASITYYLIEEPGIKFGQKLIKSFQPKV